ncbi:MAG TPA: hypothetical protein VG757_15535 [Devosia sp.]|nr:hypothetical protein [Devosia sp.]
MAADPATFVRSYFEALMESQYWPAERMLAEQRKYLGALIRHARDFAPFYANRFDALFRPGGEIDWDRWNDVPIVTRQEALEHNDALLSTNPPPNHGPTKAGYTSGSTGAPLRIMQSQRSNMVLTASLYRSQYWHQLDWSRDMLVWFGEDPEKGRLPGGDIRPNWGPPWEPRATGKRISVNRYNQAEPVLHFMRDRDFGYLSARPAAADALALESERLGIKIDLDAILTFSTGTRPDEREDFRRAFGARDIAPYSAREGQFMAYQCPTGLHYHINDESVVVEILDEAGRPCPPGVEGRVIVTPLYNYAQPLIRYEQGDLAVLGGPCACGRTLRVIERIVGRTAHLFRFPGGKTVSLSMAIDTQALLGARYWQIAQIAPLVIEVRYVPIDERVGDEAAIAQIIRQKTVPEVEIKFSRRADLNRTDGRKYIEYVYEVDESAERQSS